MTWEKITSGQQLPNRQLIRAKSDREIVRLLRQFYQLLTLHRRRISTISHRVRWTDYELRLLGHIRDGELAKLLRRSPAFVAAMREYTRLTTGFAR